MKSLYKVYLCVTWMIFLSCCGCTGENYERTLVRKILDDYDTSVRPSMNASEPLNVTFGLALTQIIDVDERNQILTTNCWLNQDPAFSPCPAKLGSAPVEKLCRRKTAAFSTGYGFSKYSMWIDYSLKWDPADYGGIKVVRIPAEKVWKPDIILYNNADSQYNLAILSTNVIVASDGNLTWLSTAIFKSSCQINVEFFPFDEQNCTMKFASWTYDGFQVNLVIGTEDGDLSNYVENGEWDLINMRQHRHVVYYSCCNEPYPDITYTIVLRRRPLFYVFNLILPCVLISGLALLSFYMPSDSGEKVTLGITTLLSMTVFLMVIGESMPPTSEKLPLIGLYYGVTISLVSFATGLSVVTLNIHHRGMRGRQLPPNIRKFIFSFLARVLCLRLEFPNRELLLSPSLVNRRNVGNPGNAPSSSTTQLGANSSSGISSRNVNQRNPHSRKLPVNDTWRIVYPDMPATPPNISCYCDAHREMRESWQRKSRNQMLDPRYSSYGNLQIVGGGGQDHSGSSSSCASGNICANCYAGMSSRFRPVMRVRGMPSTADGPHPQVTRDDSDVDFKSHSFKSARCSHCPPLWEQRLSRLLCQVHETMEKNETRMVEQDRKEMMKLEWQQAALVIDRLLLWIFVIATIGATFGILYMSPHTKLFTT